MKKNKYDELINNTFIFAVGTFGSKILSFLIVPLYTYIISTSDYGTIDIFMTAVNMLIPFTSLLIYEAEIRFLISGEMSKESVVSGCTFIFIITSILTIVAFPVYGKLLGLYEYGIFFVITLILTTYNSIWSQYLRADNKNVFFSMNGIIVTSVTVLSNLLFLLVFHWGIKGYMLSLLLAQLFAGIQATYTGKFLKYISISNIDFNVIREMLKYCVPLIPNSIMWWVMNAGDKYIIKNYLGINSNGLYAISMKIPTILSLLFSIFMQAWQISAIKEKDSKELGIFYSNVFEQISSFLLIMTSTIIILVKVLFDIFISDEYNQVWRIVPILCIANIINCYASFCGVIYLVNKKSIKSFLSTATGAFINILFNILFVGKLKLYGIATGTFLGYVGILGVRFIDMKKEISLTINYIRIVIAFLLICMQSYFVVFLGGVYGYLIAVLLFLILFIFYAKELKLIGKFIFQK